MKLKWLVPGKVKSRSWKVKGAGNQDPTTSGAAPRPGRTKDAVIPRVELKTPIHESIQAGEYCKLQLLEHSSGTID